MPRVVYINGQLLPREQAMISVFDHGLLYGDGVFEGIRIYQGRPFRLQRHVRRLYDSARAIWLEIPMAEAEMAQAVEQAVAANSDLREGYIRAVVTRGVGTLGLSPEQCRRPQIIIIVDTVAIYPESDYRRGLEVITAKTVRNHPAALDPRIKSLNYLNNILAKVEAQRAGASEAIMLNHDGFVTECTADNIFMVRRGVVLTPPVESGILEGVTRNEVIEICRGSGREIREENLRPADLDGAEECFLTGSAAEVIAVTKIDGRPVGDGRPGPVTREILDEFHRRTRGETA